MIFGMRPNPVGLMGGVSGIACCEEGEKNPGGVVIQVTDVTESFCES